MRIAVTGGAGQLGTLVLERLIERDDVESIVCLDLTPPSVVADNLTFVHADVRDEDFGRHLQGIDGLFHFAFIVTQRVEPGVFDAVNVEGSKNVFTAGAKAGVKRFVYASSIAQYGIVPGHPEPIVEDTPRRLQDDFPYSAAKYRVELFLDDFVGEHPGVKVGRLRPAILLGTHMQNPGAKLLGRMLDRGWMIDSGTGVPMPLVWDEDVADAAITILFDGHHGPFNLGADEPRTPSEIADACGLSPVEPPALLMKAMDVVVPALERLGIGEAVDPSWKRESSARVVMSSAKAVETLGWDRRCPTTVSVVQRYLDEAYGRTNPRVEAFLRLASVGKSGGGDLGPVHLSLTGRGGGDWILSRTAGRIDVQRGLPRPPKGAVRLTTEAFVARVADAARRAAFSPDEVTARGEGGLELLNALLDHGTSSRFGGWLRRLA
ncbi:MAG: NAD-dependent epimerase/dehydratase family protein [Deltaproteobacteria bacterium]